MTAGVTDKLVSDDAYRSWIQRQPSCISGKFSEYVDGEGRCIAAHVRRAGKSGTGYKEPFAMIPLTREEHDYQHSHGERACLIRFKSGFDAGKHSEMHAKKWFDYQVIKYRQKWEKEQEKCQTSSK